MALLSIIVPCYNEEAGVEAFYARTSAVCAALRGVETELLFVDDGSSDGTLSRLKALGERERGCAGCPCPGTSARRRPCTPGWSTRTASMWR